MVPLEPRPTELERSIDTLTFGADQPEPGAVEAGRPRPFAFKRIVAAVDPSPASRHVLSWAEAIAKTFGSRVWVVHVIPPEDAYRWYTEWSNGEVFGASLFHRESKEAERLVERAARHLRASVPETVPLVLIGSVTRDLVQFVTAKRADLLVVGAQGGRMRRLLLGSTADALKNHVPSSVLVAKTPPQKDRLLLATDGSRASKRAVGVGLRLARLWKGHATILHVLHAPGDVVGGNGHGDLQSAFDGLGRPLDDPRATFALDRGRPSTRIVARARGRDCGLIVMGSRGLSGLRSLVAGSVSNRVAHAAPTSVLLVKELAE